MNADNLIPNSERTPEELREMARKGGIASGEARRRKKTMREQFDLLLSLPVKPDGRIGQKIKEVADDLGIPVEELDNQMAMCLNMFSNAMSKKPTKAFEDIQATLGEKPVETISVEDKREKTKKLDNILEQLKE